MGDFGDFLQQIPAPLIVNCFVSMASFAALLVYFVYIRPRRKRAERAALENPNPIVSAQSSDFAPHDEDLPDLDMLLIDEEPLTPPPTATPAPQPYTSGQSLTVVRDQVVRLPDGRVTKGEPVLIILRDSTDNRLMIHMDDTAYRTFVNFPEIKQRFTTLMKELADSTAKPDEAPEDDRPPVVDEGLPSTLADLVSTPTPESSAAPKFVPPPPTDDGRMPGDLPNYREITETAKKGRFGIPKYEAPPVPELNLAAAIEAYLQHKLRYTPEYMHRSIHIHNAPDGGVRIEVDGKFYESVADVSDDDAREFIRTAIQEWQDRQ